MKRLISILICLLFISNVGFANEITRKESSKGFYYMTSVITALLYCATASNAHNELMEADMYFQKASDDNFNFGVYWQMYWRSMRELDRIYALEYGESAIYNQAQAEDKYRQSIRSEALAYTFLTMSAVLLFVGITKSVKEHKLKVVYDTNEVQLTMNHKF